MTTIEYGLAPDALNESLDPRDPLLRLSTFFDDGTVELLHERDRSGILAASGAVNGVRTIAFCTDGTVMGGAMGVEGCEHIVNAYDLAIAEQSPIVGIWHSGGARLAEGVKALHAVGLVFEAMIRASGYVPQISVVVGFAAESEDMVANARKKLEEKRLDLIVANDITAADSGFDVDTNRVTLIDRNGKAEELPLMSKRDVADKVLDRVKGILK